MPKSKKERRLEYSERYLKRHKNSNKARPDLVAASWKYADKMMAKEAKASKNTPTRQAKDNTAGSYLTTRGKKKSQLDKAFNYTLE